jgi:hypothetical protein
MLIKYKVLIIRIIFFCAGGAEKYKKLKYNNLDGSIAQQVKVYSFRIFSRAVR